MRQIQEAIAQLRAAGRWNPFLRCFLLVLAWLALTLVYSLAALPLIWALTTLAREQHEGSIALMLGTFAQFLSSLTVVWFFRRTLDRQSVARLGLEITPGWARELAWGTALGIGLMALSVGILSLFGWVDFKGSGWMESSLIVLLAWGLGGGATLMMVGFYEELIARGYLIQNLSSGSTLALGVALSSVIFGAAHLLNPNSSLLAGVNTGLAGLFFALLYLHTGSLWAPIGAHFGWNFAQNYILGLPVSGVDIFASYTPILLQEAGPDLVTGGAFGPEGGLVVTAILAIVSLGLLWRLRERH